VLADEVDALRRFVGLAPRLPHHARDVGDDAEETLALVGDLGGQTLLIALRGADVVDVDRHADVAAEVSSAIEARHAAAQHPAEDAVVPPLPVLDLHRLPGLECGLEDRHAARDVVGMHRRDPAEAELLLAPAPAEAKATAR